MTLTQLFSNRLPSLIMYDLDGTLVDSIPDLIIATNCMLKDLNRPVANPEDITHWVGNGITPLIKRALADDIKGDQPGRVDPALFESARARFVRRYEQEVGLSSQLYPGVRSFLEFIHNHNITQTIITNKDEQFSRLLLKAQGIHHFFDYLIGGDTLPEKKPHPLPLQHTLEKYQRSSDAALMVGDSINDITAAKAAGIQVVGVTYGYNHGNPVDDADPDCIVSNLMDLL
ncbi:phosphoglycolate phosphatase [Candidatus Sororendozoicomonas aggregata]|uniref:phosphoglycolate phosphatase n=1 Tax=Candidatus Sororendozoicomonas aggregata TaxID=3073239 RepID=UPI002ED0BB44